MNSQMILEWAALGGLGSLFTLHIVAGLQQIENRMHGRTPSD